MLLSLSGVVRPPFVNDNSCQCPHLLIKYICITVLNLKAKRDDFLTFKSDDHGNISYTYDTGELGRKRIIDYWTPERKAAAIPDDGWQTDTRLGTRGDKVSATDPQLADTSKMPFSAGAKLFFTRNNKQYVASAEIVCQRNIVLTAAHCVQDKESGALCENFLFERCYDEGESVETLTFKTLALKKYWHEQKEWKWDYAFAIVDGMSTLTAPLTYSTESIEGKDLVAFGYPTNYYKGHQMVRIDGSAHMTGFSTWEIDGDKMRGGASGGAWLLKGSNTVVGINSYGPVDEKLAYMGSPILNAEFDSLYQYVTTLL